MHKMSKKFLYHIIQLNGRQRQNEDDCLPVRPFTFKLREFVDGYLAAIPASAI